jgi:protein TonB
VAAAPPAPPLKGRPPPAKTISDADQLDRYGKLINSRVGKYVKERGESAYPRLARDRGWEGKTLVRLEFARNGKLKSVIVQSSSGYPILDQRALEIVKEVLPPVPDELKNREFSVRLPIDFNLVDKR